MSIRDDPWLRDVAERALREARALGHPAIGTGHALLGVVERPDGLAGATLSLRGVALLQIRELVAHLGLGREGFAPPDAEVSHDDFILQVMKLGCSERMAQDRWRQYEEAQRVRAELDAPVTRPLIPAFEEAVGARDAIEAERRFLPWVCADGTVAAAVLKTLAVPSAVLWSG